MNAAEIKRNVRVGDLVLVRAYGSLMIKEVVKITPSGLRERDRHTKIGHVAMKGMLLAIVRDEAQRQRIEALIEEAEETISAVKIEAQQKCEAIRTWLVQQVDKQIAPEEVK